MCIKFNYFKKNKKIKKKFKKWLPSFFLHYILFAFHYKYRKNNSLFKVTNTYKYFIAPKIATYLYWLLLPIYLVFKKNRLVFLINNISNSVGHVVCELDWFFRLTMKLNEDSKFRYVVIWPRSEVSRYASEVYGDRFYAFIVSDFIYRLILPVLMRFPDITIDCGLSVVNLMFTKEDLFKNKLTQNNKLKNPIFQRPFMEVWNRYASYYILRKETFDSYPMRPQKKISLELSNYLGAMVEKYAVVKINTNTGNATAVVTDPSTYLNAIRYLQQNGYGIVFAGREEMPEVFHELKILNYAESLLANFRHDIELIASSKFVLSSGSGFGFIADTMGIPMVATNSWHLTVPFPSRYCVTLPTLLYDKNDNPMRFSEQINFFYSQEQSSTLSTQSIKPRNASASEILAALVEATTIQDSKYEISKLQNQFKNLKLESPLFYAESKVSQQFIEKFQYLL